MCEKPGYRSNECLKRRKVNLVNYEDDGEEEVEIENLDESVFAEE